MTARPTPPAASTDLLSSRKPVASSDANWTPWQPLTPHLHATADVLRELLDGGQAFRWWHRSDGSWIGQWSTNLALLRIGAGGRVEWRAPCALATRVRAALPAYLGLTAAHNQAVDQLPWRSDPHLAICLASYPGLRVLQQPLAETLLTFLCSATKQIVQIKQMVALLAQRFGSRVLPELPLDPAPAAAPLSHALGWRLPTWEELAEASEAELRACLLGFRARYIRGVAEQLAADPARLQCIEAAAYPEAKALLCELPGVGEKVADCVLLFGAGRWEAFPVDVWILKAMARRYGLAGWTPAQVAHFGRTHFGAAAGLAQQYLFAYERAQGR